MPPAVAPSGKLATAELCARRAGDHRAERDGAGGRLLEGHRAGAERDQPGGDLGGGGAGAGVFGQRRVEPGAEGRRPRRAAAAAPASTSSACTRGCARIASASASSRATRSPSWNGWRSRSVIIRQRSSRATAVSRNRLRRPSAVGRLAAARGRARRAAPSFSPTCGSDSATLAGAFSRSQPTRVPVQPRRAGDGEVAVDEGVDPRRGSRRNRPRAASATMASASPRARPAVAGSPASVSVPEMGPTRRRAQGAGTVRPRVDMQVVDMQPTRRITDRQDCPPPACSAVATSASAG